MPVFLDTTGVSYHVEKIIKQAMERLIIITPVLQINDRVKDLLEDQNRLKIDIRIIYSESFLNKKQTRWLESLEFVKTSQCKNLNSRCYVNEQGALITSMALHQFPHINNSEMGIYISEDRDSRLYKEIVEEVQRLIRMGNLVQLAPEPKKPKVEKSEEEKTAPGQMNIRSTKPIRFVPDSEYKHEQL